MVGLAKNLIDTGKVLIKNRLKAKKRKAKRKFISKSVKKIAYGSTNK